MGKRKDDDVKEILEKLEREVTDAPPLYSNEEGEIDTCDAAFFVVDVHNLKQTDRPEYRDLLRFHSDCYRKCALQLFTHPGLLCEDGLTPIEQVEDNEYFCAYALIAIDQCNRLRKDVKLKLEKLMRVNFCFWGAEYYYMTFSAIDDNTGRAGIYQAVVREYRKQHVLGLFRDRSTQNTLAILHITGAEEHLEAKEEI